MSLADQELEKSLLEISVIEEPKSIRNSTGKYLPSRSHTVAHSLYCHYHLSPPKSHDCHPW